MHFTRFSLSNHWAIARSWRGRPDVPALNYPASVILTLCASCIFPSLVSFGILTLSLLVTYVCFPSNDGVVTPFHASTD